MDERHGREMSEAIERTKIETENSNLDEQERSINRLAAQHMEERQMAELRFESDLNFARETQFREFREWVRKKLPILLLIILLLLEVLQSTSKTSFC